MKNDPKLTAWVLGELSGAEATEMAALVAADPELQAECDRIRELAAEIEKVMQKEPIPANPTAVTAKKSTAKLGRMRYVMAGIATLVAASLIAALIVPAYFSPDSQNLAREGQSQPDAITSLAEREIDGKSIDADAFNSGYLDNTWKYLKNDQRERNKMPGEITSSLGGSRSDRPEEFKAETVVSVPDGGTVLMGGIGRLPEESIEGRPGIESQWGMPLDPTNIPQPYSDVPVRVKIRETQTTGTIAASIGINSDIGLQGVIKLDEEDNSNIVDKIYPVGDLVMTKGRPDVAGIQDNNVGGIQIKLNPQFGNVTDASQSFNFSGSDKEKTLMMVEPRILIQEEEEEYIVPADQYDRGASAAFKALPENHFLLPQDAPLSTFSIDVDTASYTLMRRNVNEFNRLPPRESVRIEEFVNYFSYKYDTPKDEKPFAAHVELGHCPWNTNNILAKIGIKGREVSREDRPALNLVFLVDVSGSMSGSNRLPLVKRGLAELVEMLEDRDRVAIVTYANNTNIALPSVSGREGRAILDSINALNAAGGTAGGDGIQRAYELAKKNFDKEAQNRVILCTDGDFNIGITDNAELEALIEKEAKSGVFLSVLGFGMGNIRDDKLKTLSSKGNGNYAYIDTFDEARKVLVDDLTGTLIVIAKDVKIQVDFNPNHVAAYRLIGYENRMLRDRDFNDDTKDAGEIGSGHTVTALYEIVPNGQPIPDPNAEPGVDPSRYAATEPATEPETIEKPAVNEEFVNELMFVKIRHKEPDGDKSELSVFPVEMKIATEISDDFRFASAVALSGMLFRESRYSGTGNFATVLELARSESTGPDEKYRKEFIELIEKAKEMRR